MRDESDIDALSFCQRPGDVLAAEAVAYSADALDAELVAHVAHRLGDDGVDGGGVVTCDPVGEVEPGALEGGCWDGVAFEEVGEDDGEVGCGERVGEAGGGGVG